MRRMLVTGAAVAACTTGLSLAVAGLASSPSAGPFAQPAAAAELPPFTGCEQLRQWYVDRALPLVGPYGLGWPTITGDLGTIPPNVRAGGLSSAAEAPGSPAAASPDSPDAPVSASTTGTNVQEAGVDEPDVAKTDGSVLVEVRGRRLVVTDVTGSEARRLGSLRLPRDLFDAEVLLLGDRVLVTGSGTGPIPVAGPRIAMPWWPGPASTRLLEVSVEDPSAPSVVSDLDVDGAVLSARQYGDTVRVVVSTTAPKLDFVTPSVPAPLAGEPLEPGAAERAATQANQELVRESRIGDWLPTVSLDGGPRKPLLGCEDVRHPRRPSGLGTVSVLTFPGGELADRDATAVTATADVVYSSADRLYLATQRSAAPLPVEGTPGRIVPGPKPVPEPAEAVTDVHAFALGADDTTYVASGHVAGAVRDRWSLDEHDGLLRVATGLGAAWDPRDNGIAVLAERGGSLEPVGSVRGLGVDEQITAVRWFDDLAVLVTFRQVDPLYTVDLSDPADPRVRGELTIPGFSSYLHPLGDHLLLGVGEDATLAGRSVGAQAAVFDLADLADPTRRSTLALGRRVAAAAGWDPRTFTYLPGQRLALVLLLDQWTGRMRLATVHVDVDGRLSEQASRPVPGWAPDAVRTLPLPDGRVALVDARGVTLLTP